MSDIGTERIRGLLRLRETSWVDEGDLEQSVLPRAERWLKRFANPATLDGDAREIALDAGAWYAVRLILLTVPRALQIATAELRLAGEPPLTPEIALQNARDLLSGLGIATSVPAILAAGLECDPHDR